jgi:hypothetical protein
MNPTDYRVIYEWTMNSTGPLDFSACPAGPSVIPMANDDLIIRITKALPGDLDGNGAVELADFVIFKAHFGQTKDNCNATGACDQIAIQK